VLAVAFAHHPKRPGDVHVGLPRILQRVGSGLSNCKIESPEKKKNIKHSQENQENIINIRF
jgi:hypothetical protein